MSGGGLVQPPVGYSGGMRQGRPGSQPYYEDQQHQQQVVMQQQQSQHPGMSSPGFADGRMRGSAPPGYYNNNMHPQSVGAPMIPRGGFGGPGHKHQQQHQHQHPHQHPQQHHHQPQHPQHPQQHQQQQRENPRDSSAGAAGVRSPLLEEFRHSKNRKFELKVGGDVERDA